MTQLVKNKNSRMTLMNKKIIKITLTIITKIQIKLKIKISKKNSLMQNLICFDKNY